jgi:hypothetical protein
MFSLSTMSVLSRWVGGRVCWLAMGASNGGHEECLANNGWRWGFGRAAGFKDPSQAPKLPSAGLRDAQRAGNSCLSLPEAVRWHHGRDRTNAWFPVSLVLPAGSLWANCNCRRRVPDPQITRAKCADGMVIPVERRQPARPTQQHTRGFAGRFFRPTGLLPGGGGGSFLSIEPRGRFVSNRIRTLGSLRDRASGSGHYDIRQEGSQTARDPDNQGLLPRVGAMKSFNLRLMSASRMDGVLCSSIRLPSEESRTREGCSEWSSSPLPLSSKHRRTLLTGWEFFSMDSGHPDIVVSMVSVKLEGKQHCETLPSTCPTFHDSAHHHLSVTSHHTPGE